jgi:hypothetical protein
VVAVGHTEAADEGNVGPSCSICSESGLKPLRKEATRYHAVPMVRRGPSKGSKPVRPHCHPKNSDSCLTIIVRPVYSALNATIGSRRAAFHAG